MLYLCGLIVCNFEIVWFLKCARHGFPRCWRLENPASTGLMGSGHVRLAHGLALRIHPGVELRSSSRTPESRCTFTRICSMYLLLVYLFLCMPPCMQCILYFFCILCHPVYYVLFFSLFFTLYNIYLFNMCTKYFYYFLKYF